MPLDPANTNKCFSDYLKGDDPGRSGTQNIKREKSSDRTSDRRGSSTVHKRRRRAQRQKLTLFRVLGNTEGLLQVGRFSTLKAMTVPSYTPNKPKKNLT